MTTNQNTCAFTGHRPKSFPWKYNEAARECVLLKEALSAQITALAERGVTEFLSGMALGVDLWSAQIVLGLQEKYPTIRLHCSLSSFPLLLLPSYLDARSRSGSSSRCLHKSPHGWPRWCCRCPGRRSGLPASRPRLIPGRTGSKSRWRWCGAGYSMGWTQEHLAQLIDRTSHTVMYMETRGQHPSLNVFYQVVTLLDISVDRFFFTNRHNKESERRQRIAS